MKKIYCDMCDGETPANFGATRVVTVKFNAEKDYTIKTEVYERRVGTESAKPGDDLCFACYALVLTRLISKLRESHESQKTAVT
jgi:hypothetical protein